jgi:anthranilate phosphoribosyltransferase
MAAGIELARAAIESGAAKAKLEALIALSNQLASPTEKAGT